MATVLTAFSGGLVMMIPILSAPLWKFRSVIGIVTLVWGGYAFRSNFLHSKEIPVRGSHGRSREQYSEVSKNDI